MAAATSRVPPPPPPAHGKRKRKEITDDEEVEVIALSVEEIIAENQFTCEFCKKGFNREQNLQLHKRAHNLPCTLKNHKNKDKKRKVYVCPYTTCVNHDLRNALSDLTSLKKHYRRKHSEKTLNCPKCYKKYAVQADLSAHLKTCGTKDYKCECGGVFSRRDSYITHRTVCDALVQQPFSMDTSFPTTGTSLGNLFGPTTFDPANNSNAQGSDFDVNVLYDRLFAVSSGPSTAMLQGSSQQSYTLANYQGTLASFTRSGNPYFPVFRDNISSNVLQNGGPSEFRGGQFNQEQEQLCGNNTVSGNADFPELQNDFSWRY